ncbi:hypothetical protein DFJ73DRAFT_832324 [Zopfochytrium polystomum]|nr:hypothetical protein DFJ73DRAFT_832324 [Zopfochytrium polystomum]
MARDQRRRRGLHLLHLRSTGFRRFLRSVQDSAESHSDLIAAVASVVGTWVVGSAVLCVTEGWTFLDALYFSFSLMTTTGYGDLYPNSSWGRTWVLCLTFAGLGVWAYALSTVVARVQAVKVSQHAKRIRAFRKMLRSRSRRRTSG